MKAYLPVFLALASVSSLVNAKGLAATSNDSQGLQTSVVPTVHNVTTDGINIFYRQAGSTNPKAPTVLLLHGFPSSSHMFRNLMTIPLLQEYRLIAPDLPSFGFTTVPAKRNYRYAFASFEATIEAFVDALELDTFAIYIFDYGAPTGLRLALKRPSSVVAIVTQNGNAYLEGLGHPFWDPLMAYWKSKNTTDRNALRPFLELDGTKSQYVNGSPHPWEIEPEAYYLDQALLDRSGIKDIQLDIFYDYRTNLPLYPKFQQYFRTSSVPVLAVWGKNDVIFIPAGAEAFRKDVKQLELHFLDAGHFALETNEYVMAQYMVNFFKKYHVFK